jgi:hypothetical protein
MLDGNREYAAMADRAYRVVTEDFEDKKYGGYYMELSSSDKVGISNIPMPRLLYFIHFASIMSSERKRKLSAR